MQGAYLYIITNKDKTVLYIGMTNNLLRRIWEHKNHYNTGSLTDKYNLEYCIYYEYFDDVKQCIARETQLKKWRREKKLALIAQINPEMRDLWDDIKNWAVQSNIIN